MLSEEQGLLAVLGVRGGSRPVLDCRRALRCTQVQMNSLVQGTAGPPAAVLARQARAMELLARSLAVAVVPETSPKAPVT